MKVLKFIKIKFEDIDKIDLPSGTYIKIEPHTIIMTLEHYKEFKIMLIDDENVEMISHFKDL